MKLIIAGSRHIQPSFEFIRDSLEMMSILDITELVCGMATGVDSAGHHWARQEEIQIKKFYADWEKYGKPAGPMRNIQMAKYADELLLIWDGKSPGSKNMKSEMERLNKPIHEIIIKSHVGKE